MLQPAATSTNTARHAVTTAPSATLSVRLPGVPSHLLQQCHEFGAFLRLRDQVHDLFDALCRLTAAADVHHRGTAQVVPGGGQRGGVNTERIRM